MTKSDDYTNDALPKKTPAEKGVHRRRTGIWLLIYAAVYGAYGLIMDKEINAIFISSIIGAGAALLGIGKVTKDSTE